MLARTPRVGHVGCNYRRDALGRLAGVQRHTVPPGPIMCSLGYPDAHTGVSGEGLRIFGHRDFSGRNEQPLHSLSSYAGSKAIMLLVRRQAQQSSNQIGGSQCLLRAKAAISKQAGLSSIQSF